MQNEKLKKQNGTFYIFSAKGRMRLRRKLPFFILIFTF